MLPFERVAHLAFLLSFSALAACAAEDVTPARRRGTPDVADGDSPSAPPATSANAPGSTPSTAPAPPTAGAMSGAGFRPITPVRLVDSRDGSGLPPAAFAGALEAGVERVIDLAGLDGPLGPTAKRVGLALNVTVTETEAAGYLRVYPCGTSPDVSMSNFGPGESVGAFTLVNASDRFCLLSSARTKVVVDAVGTLEKGGGARFSPMSPRRAFDSRSGAPTTFFTIPISDLPAGTQGVAAHVTITQPGAAGFAKAFPCGAEPTTSTINFGAAQTIGTTALVPLDGARQLCIASSTPTHVIVDVEGSFGSGKLGFVARTPERVFDSRGGEPSMTFVFNVPNLPLDAAIAAVHLTAVDAPGGAFATAHPCSLVAGNTSVVNVDGAAPRTSLAFAPVDSAARVCVTASAPLHLVADVVGVLAP